MSGIIGIYSVEGKNIFKDLTDGMIALQHRGDRGFGFCIDDQGYDQKNWFLRERNKGLVFYDIVQKDRRKIIEMEKMKPKTGIGHTLYEKSGGLQPTRTYSGKGMDIMVAMDGVLLGFQVRDEVKMKSLISQSIDKTDTFFEAGEKIMEELDGRGPYNVVMNLRDSRNGEYYLVAFRDPKGMKPLCIGEGKKGKYVIASENKAFQNIKADFVRDVEPGEMIVISDEGIKSKVLAKQEHAHCAFEWVYFASHVSDIEGQNVYKVRKKLGLYLAERYPDVDIDQVICSPDSGRGVAIGFQQAITRKRMRKVLSDVEKMKNPVKIKEYLRDHLMGAFVPFEEGVEKNPTAPRTFQIEDDLLRDIAKATKFYFNEHILRGKKSGAGDDSIVRGGVFKDGMVKKAGDCRANSFGAIISCPPLSHSCVKDPVSKDFAALGMRGSVEKIGKRVARKLGLDFVLYPTEEDLDRAIGLKDTCKACFNGKYPVRDELIPR